MAWVQEHDAWCAGRLISTGPAARCGYEAAPADALPEQAVESFPGVGDPFSLDRLGLRRSQVALSNADEGHWEIIDYASDDKPDMPSGTSQELAEALGQVRAPAAAVALSDLHGPVEARGTEVAGTRIHSVRLPSFVVTTEVVFGGPGERLVMRHDPGLTPAPYVAGTLLAVRKVSAVVGVRRGLDSLLFGKPAPDPASRQAIADCGLRA